ncbi:ferredoxin [Rhodobacterales bacterium HKCCE3408]|nr:ferredoxin [Rhodobacterales bacterium HKCCE3408]
MDLDTIQQNAAAERLDVLGAFHPDPADGAPEATGTLVLLGPREPGFWDHVTATPEFTDGAADPLDRWSARVIAALAVRLGGTALFPFGGPPYRPFLSWATRAGTAWASPVTLLVHHEAGLMVSYRGALALPERIDLPPLPEKPCDTCDRPCLTACPVNALTGDGYDIAACHTYLETPPGQDCLTRGCAVRRACPVSRGYGRTEAQSAFHMRSFHP